MFGLFVKERIWRIWKTTLLIVECASTIMVYDMHRIKKTKYVVTWVIQFLKSMETFKYLKNGLSSFYEIQIMILG